MVQSENFFSFRLVAEQAEVKAYLCVITFSINIKMCGKMSFVFVWIIEIVVFRSASKGMGNTIW